MGRNQRTGTFGEAVAVQELERRGYRILARNFTCRGGEADIVAEDADALVFVEVKARRTLEWGLPIDAVTWTKQQRLGVAALHYCAEHDPEAPHERPIRFDVVEVVLGRRGVSEVRLHQGAFSPDE